MKDNQMETVELQSPEFSQEEVALAAAGVLRLPPHASLPDDFWTEPRPGVAATDAINAVVEERRTNRY